MSLLSLLEVQDLAHERGTKQLFENVSFSVGAGELLHIQGSNGAGKTTLLRILCGLIVPDEGRVKWAGKDISEYPDEYRKDLVYLGHAAGIKDALTVNENIRFGALLGAGSLPDTLDDVLNRLNLRNLRDRQVHTLSAGQKRRVNLARLIVARAKLWVLDEPFTALDAQGAQLVESLLMEHVSRGGVAVFTSHQPPNFADANMSTVRLGDAA